MRSEYDVESLKPVGLADGGLAVWRRSRGGDVLCDRRGIGSLPLFHKLQTSHGARRAKREGQIFGKKSGAEARIRDYPGCVLRMLRRSTALRVTE